MIELEWQSIASDRQYEHQELTVNKNVAFLYAQVYLDFGWEIEKATTPIFSIGKAILRFKRPAVSCNNPNMTRLQREFELAIGEIEALEQARSKSASIPSILVGVAGSIFVAVALITGLYGLPEFTLPLMLIGFLGCILSLFCYLWIYRKKTAETDTELWKKFAEIHRISHQAVQILESP